MKISLEIPSPFWQYDLEWDYPVLPRVGEYIDLAFLVPENLPKHPSFWSAKIARIDWVKIKHSYPVLVLCKSERTIL